MGEERRPEAGKEGPGEREIGRRVEGGHPSGEERGAGEGQREREVGSGDCCHLCGRELPRGRGRYVVEIQVYAPYEILEIDEEELRRRDLEAEMRALLRQLKKADPAKVEERVYRAWRYLLCEPCRALYSKDPLGRGRLQ